MPNAFGPFEVRGEIGRGVLGVVYLGWDAEHDRTAAVKLFTSAPKGASAVARLRRDAQAAGALGHPNIAAVLGVGDHDGQPWVATELVPGVSLAQVLRSRAPMPIERVLDVWRQLCEGLAHAHREGVFHLDLKPTDVRLTPSGEVKMVDFGSWHLKALARQGPGPAEEGLHYRAPEIVSGRRPDRRADVFSVGGIVYELVSYRKAFPGDSTTDVVRGLTRGEPDLACLPRTAFTPGFERVLGVSLARAPEERHASFEDVHADLVQLVRDTVPRMRTSAADSAVGPPEREELLALVTRARAEDRLEEAMEGCRKLLDLDTDDEAARRAMSEIESVLLDREVDGLVGMALSYAADGEFALATGIAEKVERLAPWSPRYLQVQVYLDEEGARRRADALVATARDHLAAGDGGKARAAALDALAAMPGHALAHKLIEELPEADPPAAERSFDPEATSEPEARGQAAPAPEFSSLPAPLAAAVMPPLSPASTPSREPATAPPPETATALPPEPVSAPPPEPVSAPPPEPAIPTTSVSPRAAATSAATTVPPPVPPEKPAPSSPLPDAQVSEAVALSGAALRHFLKDEHDEARRTVERALALDPSNRRALDLQKILRVLG